MPVMGVQVDLGDVQISPLRQPYRGDGLVAGEPDPGHCHLVLSHALPVQVGAEEPGVVLRPDEFALISGRWPWLRPVGLPMDPPMAHGLSVRLTRSRLGLSASQLDILAARPISGHTGVGALTAGYLRQLAAGGNRYRTPVSGRACAVTVDLVTAMLAEEARSRQPAGDAVQRELFVRALHRMFQADGTTVGGWIRGQRLERCRRDLADVRLRAQAVHCVAHRWGFTDLAHFSRLFRAAYAASPAAYREQMLAAHR